MSAHFMIELRELLNRHSKENGSNTPDYMLAGFLADCLTAFDAAVCSREKWYGRAPKPIPPPPDPSDSSIGMTAKDIGEP